MRSEPIPYEETQELVEYLKANAKEFSFDQIRQYNARATDVYAEYSLINCGLCNRPINKEEYEAHLEYCLLKKKNHELARLSRIRSPSLDSVGANSDNQKELNHLPKDTNKDQVNLQSTVQ